MISNGKFRFNYEILNEITTQCQKKRQYFEEKLKTAQWFVAGVAIQEVSKHAKIEWIFYPFSFDGATIFFPHITTTAHRHTPATKFLSLAKIFFTKTEILPVAIYTERYYGVADALLAD